MGLEVPVRRRKEKVGVENAEHGGGGGAKAQGGEDVHPGGQDLGGDDHLRNVTLCLGGPTIHTVTERARVGQQMIMCVSSISILPIRRLLLLLYIVQQSVEDCLSF